MGSGVHFFFGYRINCSTGRPNCQLAWLGGREAGWAFGLNGTGTLEGFLAVSSLSIRARLWAAAPGCRSTVAALLSYTRCSLFMGRAFVAEVPSYRGPDCTHMQAYQPAFEITKL
ncbi:MAG TPA: hypothetical protein VMY43_01835 [Methanothrix sp.]|nr:hypothetical protein [Methanothrix sp.]